MCQTSPYFGSDANEVPTPCGGWRRDLSAATIGAEQKGVSRKSERPLWGLNPAHRNTCRPWAISMMGIRRELQYPPETYAGSIIDLGSI